MTPTTLGEAALAGVLAGYAIAIPVGAIAALLIMLGAQHGARAAAGGALGAAYGRSSTLIARRSSIAA